MSHVGDGCVCTNVSGGGPPTGDGGENRGGSQLTRARPRWGSETRVDPTLGYGGGYRRRTDT